MASNDLISIIIPVKNEKDRIRTIIDGLYRQTYRPIEVIFVDGDSTDGTVEEIMNVIKEHSSDDFRVRLTQGGRFWVYTVSSQCEEYWCTECQWQIRSILRCRFRPEGRSRGSK